MRHILFIGEAVTLAHVARPAALAQTLDNHRYTVTLACDARYHRLLGEVPFELRPLKTIPSTQFTAALAKGKPVYDTATLRDYAREDLALIKALKPDLVVGDFRISLAVSTQVAAVPYFTITNAYWSPYSRLPYLLPDLPIIDRVGVSAAQVVFQLICPLVFAYHTLPLNRVRRDYGLPSLGFDLREIYTHADRALYADIPQLVPTDPLPPTHSWLGPILWSPAVEPPDWWSALPQAPPKVYVTLGSSGESDRLLPIILEGLAELPVIAMVATAGQAPPTRLPANARVAAFLPGTEAAARSRLVICNGGSPTTQQALAAGVPVLGIASNMDQHLNMFCLEQAHAGIRLRAGQLSADQVKTAVQRLLNEQHYQESAARLTRVIQAWNTGQVFAQHLEAQLKHQA